ncbi:MAG: leucine-rich repeat domain-containing protein [Clostridia bacterium]|nr:leucine-rich repeat domain-containing protein [Clostridia bacterium]
MAKVVTDNQYYADIAQAIRTAKGEDTLYRPSEMAEATGDIQTAAQLIAGTITGAIVSDVTRVRDFLFYDCPITSASLPNATEFGKSAFQYSKIEELYAPSLTNLSGSHAIQGCSKLTRLHLPELLKTNSYAFQSDSKLSDVYLPKLTALNVADFYGCSSLAVLDLPSVERIAASVFTNASKLTALILRYDGICTLASAMSKTPIADGTGYVYVPSVYVEAYQAATNWSTHAAQFRALEAYTVDGTVTGELDTTRI